MKAYPTVADLPEDVRARFSGDALEVYRAAYHISYAYDGHDPFVATTRAYKAVQENFSWVVAGLDFVAFVFVAGMFRRSGLEAYLGGIAGEIFRAIMVLSNVLLLRLTSAKWLEYRWRRREAELLDADGNPTLPGAVASKYLDDGRL